MPGELFYRFQAEEVLKAFVDLRDPDQYIYEQSKQGEEDHYSPYKMMCCFKRHISASGENENNSVPDNINYHDRKKDQAECFIFFLLRYPSELNYAVKEQYFTQSGTSQNDPDICSCYRYMDFKRDPVYIFYEGLPVHRIMTVIDPFDTAGKTKYFCQKHRRQCDQITYDPS